MAMKFAINQRNVSEPSTESLFDRLKFAFSSESKVEDKINELVKNLSSVDGNVLKDLNVGISTYQYQHIKQFLVFSQTVTKVSDTVVGSIKDLFDAADYLETHTYPDGDKGDVEGISMQLQSGLSTAGASIRSAGHSTHKIEALLAKYKVSKKTLGELGYTSANLKQIVDLFRNDNNLIKSVAKEIRKLETGIKAGDYIIDLKSYEDADEDDGEDIARYIRAVRLNTKIIKHVDYFLFCLAKKLDKLVA